MDIINTLPHTSKWLELLEEVKEEIIEKYDNPETRQWMLEQINIAEQINNLKTYPYIKKLLQEKKIKLMGWYYAIETGEIYIFNEKKKEFQLSD